MTQEFSLGASRIIWNYSAAISRANIIKNKNPKHPELLIPIIRKISRLMEFRIQNLSRSYLKNQAGTITYLLFSLKRRTRCLKKFQKNEGGAILKKVIDFEVKHLSKQIFYPIGEGLLKDTNLWVRVGSWSRMKINRKSNKIGIFINFRSNHCLKWKLNVAIFTQCPGP